MPPVDCRRSELGNRSVQQRATEPFLCDSVVTATPGAGSRLAVTVLVDGAELFNLRRPPTRGRRPWPSVQA